jgi:hypothetical protein
MTAFQQQSLNNFYWNAYNEEGLKMRVDYLFSYALCCRGDNIRNLKFSEIEEVFYAEEGPRGAHVLRTAWRK